MKRVTLASAIATVIALACAATPVRAEEPQLRHIRVCDVSACYYAWNVVDSDDDGVSDADEVVAGFDPHDPASRPPLPLMVEMIGAQSLPTFEFGVGQMVVRPPDLQETLEKLGMSMPDSPLAAFPIKGRADAVKHLGLDPTQVADFGISIESEGFTLVRGFNEDTKMPERRVGGVRVSWISEGDDGGAPPPEEGPKVVEYEKFKNGDTFVKLDTGDTVLIKPDGSYDRRGPDGKPKTSGFSNPDADPGNGEPTDEQFKAWERVHNATQLTVFGWSPIEIDPKDIEDRKGTIILIDPNYMDYEGMASGPPQIDTAQPETRPDLPNPGQPDTGCWPKCD